MKRLIILLLLHSSILFITSCQQGGNLTSSTKTNSTHEEIEDEVRSAVLGLYKALSDENADAAEVFIMPNGYSEFSKTGTLRHLDMDYIRQFFSRDVDLQFNIKDMRIEVAGDGAVVTGYRIHSWQMEDGVVDEGTQRLSMFWLRTDGMWKLIHVHLSPADGEEFRKSFVEVHQSWFDGLLEENHVLIDQILSEDITLGFPGGNVMPRQEFIGHLKNGTLFYDSASHEYSNIRIYGSTGIINGKSTLAYRFQLKNGEFHKGLEDLTYTAVYVLKDNWEMVAWQSTRPATQSRPN